MVNHAPLSAHERLTASRLLKRLKDAQMDALMASKGPNATTPGWLSRAAHDYFWEAHRELADWLAQDNAVGVRSCMEAAHRLPLPR